MIGAIGQSHHTQRICGDGSQPSRRCARDADCRRGEDKHICTNGLCCPTCKEKEATARFPFPPSVALSS